MSGVRKLSGMMRQTPRQIRSDYQRLLQVTEADIKKVEADIKKWEDYINELEEALQNLGDDAQRANVDLQNALQKQQRTLNAMRQGSQRLHDAAILVLRAMTFN